MSGLMTQLEAVNAVLSIAGDAPVTSLAGEYEQAVIANRILLDTSREEQSKGLWFNINESMTLLPNVSGQVELPSTAITASVIGDNGKLIQRGLKIYDRENNTFVLNRTIYADVTEYLDWDLLPQTFRQYVTALSQEQYNNEYFGSTEVARTLERRIAQLLVAVRSEDMENRDINLFRAQGSATIAFGRRRRP